MSTPDLKSILNAALLSGIAHNNGAGGQYLLCATEAQLRDFAAFLAITEAAATVPGQIEVLLDTADEWANYVIEDRAPMTLRKYLERALATPEAA